MVGAHHSKRLSKVCYMAAIRACALVCATLVALFRQIRLNEFGFFAVLFLFLYSALHKPSIFQLA